jgi:hypothetical protein
MRPPYAARRVDATAKALTAEAKRLGCGVAPLGGAVDAVLWLGPITRLVDFKSPGGTLTASQTKLVQSGAPIVFVATVAQLEAVVAQMRREALR